MERWTDKCGRWTDSRTPGLDERQCRPLSGHDPWPGGVYLGAALPFSRGSVRVTYRVVRQGQRACGRATLICKRFFYPELQPPWVMDAIFSTHLDLDAGDSPRPTGPHTPAFHLSVCPPD